MPSWQRLYLAVCAALVGFATAYGLCEWAGWQRLAFQAVEGRWQLARPPLSPDQLGYMGLVVWGLGGAIVAAAATLLVCSIVRRPASDRVLQIFGAWAITAILLTGAFFTWGLWPF